MKSKVFLLIFIVSFILTGIFILTKKDKVEVPTKRIEDIESVTVTITRPERVNDDIKDESDSVEESIEPQIESENKTEYKAKKNGFSFLEYIKEMMSSISGILGFVMYMMERRRKKNELRRKSI